MSRFARPPAPDATAGAGTSTRPGLRPTPRAAAQASACSDNRASARRADRRQTAQRARRGAPPRFARSSGARPDADLSRPGDCSSARSRLSSPHPWRRCGLRSDPGAPSKPRIDCLRGVINPCLVTPSREAEAPQPVAGEERMPEKSMKEKLAAGELVLCLNLRLARSVDVAMVAKAGGYDALYVDMQHAPYSIETTATICAAALGIGITPLVRVPNHDAQWMSRVLDGGAQGVILPDVNTRAEAEAIVGACRFPPLGRRSVMGLGPA